MTGVAVRTLAFLAGAAAVALPAAPPAAAAVPRAAVPPLAATSPPGTAKGTPTAKGPATAKSSPKARTSPADARDREPNPKACVHNDPALERPTAQQAAAAPWPRDMLRYDQAWTYTRGARVTVAVVDSGVDAAHEQLTGHVVTGSDITGGSVRPGGTTDCFGHGTAVAGIIAARPLPGRGVVGIAPEATIRPVRESWGIDDNGHATTSTADALLLAMRTAIDSGAGVVNVSITVADVELRAEQRKAFNDIAQYASDRNVLIVAASGNRSQYTRLRDQTFTTYPARLATWYRNVIAVSGVTADGAVDRDAVTGPFVTVAAPDQGFLSTLEHGGLVAVSGTSYAAPMVSGLAALLRSRFPTATPADIRARITATADHPSTRLPNPSVGYGVINPLAAVTAVLPPPDTATPQAVPVGPLQVPTDPHARLGRAALAAGGGVVAVTALLWSWVLVARRGRRRRWRPGRSLAGPPSPAPSPVGRAPAQPPVGR